HYFFKAPAGDWQNSASKIADGVDIRITGGYVLIAPSVYKGKPYKWIEAPEVGPDSLPLPPQWLVDALAVKPTVSAAAPIGDLTEGKRNDALHSFACKMRRFGYTPAEILGALLARNQERCKSPLEDSEVEQIAKSAAKHDPIQEVGPRTVKAGLKEHKGLRAPLVHGLLRHGETMNIIAPTKVRKSWLAYSLALSIITGKKWLDEFQSERGRVLLIDNELHDETLLDRIPKVAEALGVTLEEYGEQFDYWTFRGRQINIDDLRDRLAAYEPGTY